MKRQGKQCRERYSNHLDSSIIKGAWTDKEDELIIREQAKFGNKWSTISKMLPGRYLSFPIFLYSVFFFSFF